MPSPIVSVIMPVFNAEKYVGEALSSLIRQTFTDLEIVVVDDGSTDGSMKVVEGIDDPRVKIVRHSRNCGLAPARNTGLAAARGEYIAWLDADDVSDPKRIFDQVRYLDSHNEVAICGAWVKTFGEQPGQRWRFPTDDATLKTRMLFDDPFATSSVMLRRSVLLENGLWFDESFSPAEDYELWERVLRAGKCANIPRFLTSYRLHSAQTSVNAVVKQRTNAWRVQERQLHRLGVFPTVEEREIHTKLGLYQYAEDEQFMGQARLWLERLSEANKATAIYPPATFDYVLFTRWVGVCGGARKRPAHALKMLGSSPLARAAGLVDKHRLHLMARCFLGPVVRPILRAIRTQR